MIYAADLASHRSPLCEAAYAGGAYKRASRSEKGEALAQARDIMSCGSSGKECTMLLIIDATRRQQNKTHVLVCVREKNAPVGSCKAGRLDSARLLLDHRRPHI